MVDCLLVPDASFVENEFLVALRATEHHIRVEHVHVPQQGSSTVFCVNFFQVTDVDVDAGQLAEQMHFVENDLL